MKKTFYIHPPLLVAINFAILMLIGIFFIKKTLSIIDYVLIVMGAILSALFILSLILSHKNDQAHIKPNEVDRLITSGVFSFVRHPNFCRYYLHEYSILVFFQNAMAPSTNCNFYISLVLRG